MSQLQATLSEVVEFVRGVTFDRGQQLAVPTSTSIAVLRAGNIQDSLNTTTDLIFVPSNIVSPTQILRKGDIAICLSSGSPQVVGKTAPLESEWSGTIGGFCGIVRSKNIDPTYLSFWLRGPQYLKWRDEQARGANIQNLRFSELAKLTIRLPERLEQRRIAARLKAQLAEVETTRQAVQAQWTEFQLLKSKAFQSLFDNIADWRPIGSVARLQSGYAFKSETFKPSGIRLLRNANILPGKVYWDNSVHISEEDAQKFPSYELATGDVLISLDRPIISSGIKVARVSETDLPALLLQRVGRFLLDKSRCDADYLYAYLQTDRFITEISGHDQSLGVPHISPTQVEAVEIPLPDLPTQRRIAKRLVEITDTWTMATKALQRQLEDLTVLPQHLLAQAFEN